MIKKTFKDFILLLENVPVENETDDFFYAFDSAIKELDGTWWSHIAKKNSGYDSDEIWDHICISLDNNGLTWDDVKKHKKDILNKISEYSTKNAYVDVMLYNLDSKYKVGGWDDSITSDYSEIYIKYRYGYHQTTYGRIFIKSYWGTIENFIDSVASNILGGFIEDTGCVNWIDRKELENDMVEEGDLVKYEAGKSIVYLENFYYIAKPFLIGLKTHGLNYEKFKSFFFNWIDSIVGDENIEDRDDYVIIDFSDQF